MSETILYLDTDPGGRIQTASLAGMRRYASGLHWEVVEVPPEDSRPELTILEDWGGFPHLARNGAAEISLAVADGDWTAWRLDTAGRRLAQIPVVRDPATGRLAFMARTDYDSDAATLFYELFRHL